MPSRVERYEKPTTIHKRVTKNQELYQDLKRYNNYREVSAIEPVIEKETFDLEEAKGQKSRNVFPERETIQTEKLSSLLMMDEEKEHDINKILKDAKKTRVDKDELEEKRKLKKKEYNITSQVDVNNLEELKEQRKKSGVREEDQEEIKELIDTIYSKKLRDEIDEELKNTEDKDLMSDLLPSSLEETVIDENLSKEIIEKEKSEKKHSEKIENSFFTKSMDLSTEDLEDDDDDELFIDEKKIPVWIIILGIIGILIVVIVAGYFIYNSMK